MTTTPAWLVKEYTEQVISQMAINPVIIYCPTGLSFCEQTSGTNVSRNWHKAYKYTAFVTTDTTQAQAAY